VTLASPAGAAEDGQISLWITAPAFIDEALVHLDAGTTPRVPVFQRTLAGADCDERQPWHVDGAEAEWADSTIEECDASVAFVSANPTDWTSRVRPSWCPWLVRVLRVVDRR